MSNRYVVKVLSEYKEHLGNDLSFEMDYLDVPHTIGYRSQQIWLAKAIKLISSMQKNGGTEEEIKRAEKFALVCLDAEKKCLSIFAAKEDLGISELMEKYI